MSGLRTFQKKVSELISAGQNVILQAPTGAGKTRAALFPFIDSLNDASPSHGKLPKKCIYSVPMRILANQFGNEYSETVAKFASRYALKDISVKIQTGENSQDPQFAGNLIFATIDQALGSFLISPYSLSKRKANLNAGAVAGAYLVFDEFHLFDPESTLPTTLHMLKMLKGVVPFLLMTATFSQEMLDSLAHELNAVVVGATSEEREEFAQLPSQNKQRFYHSVEGIMTAESILEKHEERSLVICNTVERARKIFEDLRECNPDAELILLHSQLLPEDRKEREETIRKEFGPNAKGGNYIVVSTQAIEVGVDMSSSALHTELAPANALIQRAGRCARYENQEGHVYIYSHALKDDELVDLREEILPYKEQKAVIQKTWDAFSNRDESKALKFDDEQAILSEAHGEEDAMTVRKLRENSRNHRNDMLAVMRGDNNSDARQLIRNVIAQPITIHSDPKEVAKDPFAYPSFSLHPGTTQGLIEKWLERRSNEWDIAMICESQAKDFENEAQANEERYYAEKINDKKSGWMARLLVVHPSLVTYDKTLGLITLKHNEDPFWEAKKSEKKESQGEGKQYKYRLETYEKHIELVYRAFKDYWKESLWAAQKLEQTFGWQVGSVTKAAHLAVLLHDVGKLSKDWQNWVRKYQKAIVEAELLDESHLAKAGQAYAHTDFRSDNPRYKEIQNSIKPPRPWHAVEGALAVMPIVMEALEGNQDLSRAVLSAIARHHAAHSDSYGEFELEADCPQHILTTLPKELSLDTGKLWGLGKKFAKGSDTSIAIADPRNEGEYLAYMLIVRALRRADSTGTERGSKPDY